MDGSRVSDFSIERILSPQLGHQHRVAAFPPGGFLQDLRGGFSLHPGSLRPPAPVPVPCCLRYPAMSFGDGFRYTDFPGVYHNSGVHLRFTRDFADAPLPAGYRGYPRHVWTSAQSQPCQKPRMRTVFTDSQTKQLEALFQLTDYPAVETRAEVARSTGLSEETVRVWFKNRRARRKRQYSGSKVKSPSPPPSTEAETKVFTTVL
ncbi:dharma [Aulostomus maculatus]